MKEVVTSLNLRHLRRGLNEPSFPTLQGVLKEFK